MTLRSARRFKIFKKFILNKEEKFILDQFNLAINR